MLRRTVLLTFILILVLSASAKLVSSSKQVKPLDSKAPIFEFMNLRQIYVVAAILELGVAGMLIIGRRPVFKFGLVAWLSSVFLAFRIGLWLIDYQAPCRCLGDPTGWLPISREQLDFVAKCLLGYMALTSYGFLTFEWLRQKQIEKLPRELVPGVLNAPEN